MIWLVWAFIAVVSATKVVAPWKRVPFSLGLLETFAAEELYLPAYEIVSGISNDGEPLNDEEMYRAVRDLIEDNSRKELFDVSLASKMYFPRVNVHLDNAPENECVSWFVLNGKNYCDPNDIFYLKTGELKNQQKIPDSDVLLPYDRVIGSDENAPILVFYGDIQDENFFEFTWNLYESANIGKIRYVWRYVSNEEFENEELVGYGIVGEPKLNLDLLDKLPVSHQKRDYDESIDYKIASALKNIEHKSGLDHIEAITEVINNLPAYLPYFDSAMIDTDLTLEIVKNTESGYDNGFLGFYLNGMRLKAGDLDYFHLFSRLKDELRIIQELSKLEYFKSHAVSKRALNSYSNRAFPYLQSSTPRYNIKEFDDLVVYFNDLEKDDIYKNTLTKDLGAFFEKSEFGTIPAYRENWNEVVFVLDLTDREAALEYATHLKNVMAPIKKGYPQRIGVIPYLANGYDELVLQNLYRYKTDPEMFIEVLRDFSQGKQLKPKKTVSVPSFERFTLFYEKFDIHSPSIIVNGKIQPFQSNTWHYFITKVTKEDVAYLRQILTKRGLKKGRHDISITQLLHTNSLKFRDLQIIPEYISDESFVIESTEFLEELRMLPMSVEYVKDDTYMVIHTLTLVDDFSGKDGLMRLSNLLQIEISGTRIRIVNNSADDKNFIKLKSLIEKRVSHLELLNAIDAMTKKSSAKKSDSILKNFFTRYIPYYSDSFVLSNGKFVSFNHIWSSEQFRAVIAHGAHRTITALSVLEELFPNSTADDLDSDFSEIFGSILSYAYFQTSNRLDTESLLPRMDLNRQSTLSCGISSKKNNKAAVDLTVIFDPANHMSQKMLSLALAFEKLSFVNLKVQFQAVEKYNSLIYISNSYMGLFPTVPSFEDGQFITPSLDATGTIDAPGNWMVVEGKDNYELKSLILEGYVHQDDSSVVFGESDVIVGYKNLSTTTMQSFGYFQLPYLPSFSLDLNIDNFEIDYFKLIDKFEAPRYLNLEPWTLETLKPSIKVISKSDTKRLYDKDDTVHIFSIAYDDETETLLKATILSVVRSTSKDVKFWLPSTISPDFVAELKKLSQKHGFAFELVDYQWPSWLHKEYYQERTMLASKFLFLDVIMPNVARVITLDPGAVVRSDLAELYNVKLSPRQNLAAVPFGDTTDAPRFWEGGYWSQVLDGRPFCDPSVVVFDLSKMRARNLFDKMRVFYHRASKDTTSLQVLDRDLLNSLQKELVIHALDGSWAWCATWDEISLRPMAKIVTLCNTNKILELADVLQETAKNSDAWTHDEL